MVIAQEEEVRAIADEHLEREVALKALLEDLYQENQVGGRPVQASTLGQAKPGRVKSSHVILFAMPVRGRGD